MHWARLYKYFLIIGWLAVQIYLYNQLSIKVVYDSYRYLQTADQLVNTHALPDGHNLRYIGYSLFLAGIFGLGGSIKTAVWCQLIVAGLATIAFYQVAKKLLTSETSALIAVTCLILFVELSQWNLYILTESLFISSAIFAFYFLLVMQKWWHYLLYLGFLVFITLVRPNGFMIPLAALCFIFVRWWQLRPSYRLVLVLSLLPVLVLSWFVLNNYLLLTFNIVEVYQRGDIIFGYWGLLIKPENIPSFDPHTSPLAKIGIFIGHNPVYFVKAGSLKLLYFFGHVKPYYSLIHNIATALFLYPLYILAFKARSLNKPALAFILALIGMQALMVFFTTEDWDGRFLMPLLPFVFLMSAVGLKQQIKAAKNWLNKVDV